MLSQHSADTPEAQPPTPIGRGTYGRVFREANEHGEAHAVKEITHFFNNRNTDLRNLREIKLLRILKHPNIINLRQVKNTNESEATLSQVGLVMDLSKTDLFKILDDPWMTFDNDIIQLYLYQILKGVYFIHSAGMMHRDLKPTNILVEDDGTIKICDFGLARATSIHQAFSQHLPEPLELKRELTRDVITYDYRSPEVTWELPYGPAADMWSVGCILAEMLMKLPLYPGRYNQLFPSKEGRHEQMKKIFRLIGTPTATEIFSIENSKVRKALSEFPRTKPINLQSKFPGANLLLLNLLRELLKFDPSKRITAQNALAHPLFANMHVTNPELCTIETFSITSLVQANGNLTPQGNSLLNYYQFEATKHRDRTFDFYRRILWEEICKDTPQIEKREVSCKRKFHQISGGEKNDEASDEMNSKRLKLDTQPEPYEYLKTPGRFSLFSPPPEFSAQPSNLFFFTPTPP